MGTVPAINYQPTRFQTTFYKDDCVCTLGELFVVIQIHVVLFTELGPIPQRRHGLYTSVTMITKKI